MVGACIASAAIQHADILPLLNIAHAFHHARRIADVGFSRQIVLLPLYALKRAEEARLRNMAEILEAGAGILNLRYAQPNPSRLRLFRKRFKLGKRLGKRPAVLFHQRLVVGDAVTVVGGGQHVDCAVIRHIPEP